MLVNVTGNKWSSNFINVFYSGLGSRIHRKLKLLNVVSGISLVNMDKIAIHSS